jgi:hypothetical protein
MLYGIYLKKGTVYLPTTVNQGTARYREVEPVTVIPLADTEGLRRAMRGTIPKENRFVPPSVDEARKPPVLLKYTGDKSWSAFMRGTSSWWISEKDGKYQIRRHRVHRKGYWEPDPNQTIEFPLGTSLDVVIDRLIAILQEVAQQ